MTITVQELLNRVGDDIGKTISATSTDPTLSRALRYYNRVVDSVGQICLKYKSDLSRTTQVITTVSGQAEYPDFKDIMHTPDKWGYVLLTSSKSEIKLISERDSQGYGFSSGSYAQPEAFYINGKNYIVFCSTPNAVYLISIPFWRKFPPVASLSNTITGISQENPCVVTSANHPFITDDRVYIDSVVGMTQVNGSFYDVTKKTANTFSLQNTNSTAYTIYGSLGTVYPCVPFSGIMDNLITVYMGLHLQNREEYDIQVESGFFQKLESDIIEVLGMRKKTFHLKARGYKG